MRSILLIATLISSTAFAQTIHVCQKNGKQVMTDQPCETIGATTKQIRTGDTFKPLSGGGGLTDSERRMAAEYRQRDEMQDRQREVARANAQYAAQQEEAQNATICRNLDNEKKQIVAALRQNSTQWLNDRHRAVNDEMYRLRCKTL